MQSSPNTRASLRSYLDGSLIAFVVVMVAAAAITSHGTFVFYSYILPIPLAVAASIVLTTGIPLLVLAAVLDKASRVRYIVGMIVLLAMEGIAQYFQCQAIFVQAVRRQFPEMNGIDVATFAQQPWGRLLPLLYLAACTKCWGRTATRCPWRPSSSAPTSPSTIWWIRALTCARCAATSRRISPWKRSTPSSIRSTSKSISGWSATATAATWATQSPCTSGSTAS